MGKTDPQIFTGTSMASCTDAQKNRALMAAAATKVGHILMNPFGSRQYLHAPASNPDRACIYVFDIDVAKKSVVLTEKSDNDISGMFIVNQENFPEGSYIPVKLVNKIENGKQTDKTYKRPDCVYYPATKGGNPDIQYGHNAVHNADGRYVEPFAIHCTSIDPTITASYDSSEAARKANHDEAKLRTRMAKTVDGADVEICVTTVRNQAKFEHVTFDQVKELIGEEVYDALIATTISQAGTMYGAAAAETLAKYVEED